MDYKADVSYEEQVEPNSLAKFFAGIIDQQKRRRVRYQLAPHLALLMLAKLCRADKPVEIADWVSERADRLRRALGLSWKRMPHHSAYRRILASWFKIEELERQAGEFIASLEVKKDNHPTLRAEIEAHFTAPRLPAFVASEDFRTHRTIEKGHGRIEERTLTASSDLNDYLDWPYLGQVFEIKRETIICNTGQTRSQTVYGIISHEVEQADAKTLVEINRAHWGIENGRTIGAM